MESLNSLKSYFMEQVTARPSTPHQANIPTSRKGIDLIPSRKVKNPKSRPIPSAVDETACDTSSLDTKYSILAGVAITLEPGNALLVMAGFKPKDPSDESIRSAVELQRMFYGLALPKENKPVSRSSSQANAVGKTVTA